MALGAFVFPIKVSTPGEIKFIRLQTMSTVELQKRGKRQ